MRALDRVRSVYSDSDADATRRLYADLLLIGAAGELAVNLLRAAKKSERAKIYRGQKHRYASYDGKQWAMGEIARILTANPTLVASWGWKIDPKQEFHKWVMYVDLPQGQVSFHTAARGAGPHYQRDWDGREKMTPWRLFNYAAQLLEPSVPISA